MVAACVISLACVVVVGALGFGWISTKLPICSDRLCGLHGTCREKSGNEVGSEKFECLCLSGWRGPSCALPTGCDDNPCGFHGRCSSDGSAHTCHCAPGWASDRCDTCADGFVGEHCAGAFVVSGLTEEKTEPFNGIYNRTELKCSEMPVYLHQFEMGTYTLRYLYRYTGGSVVGPWQIATATSLKTLSCTPSMSRVVFRSSRRGNVLNSTACPASPDAPGCKNSWQQLKLLQRSSEWVFVNLSVVAVH